jgi:delta-aminolevulinic acid dehydratase/porphobilinogen synthase
MKTSLLSCFRVRQLQILSFPFTFRSPFEQIQHTMLNILIITLASDRSTLFGISADIDPRFIQRAAVHESRIVEDATQYITTDWPDVVLVQSSLILRGEDSSKKLRNHLIDRTGTAVLQYSWASSPTY